MTIRKVEFVNDTLYHASYLNELHSIMSINANVLVEQPGKSKLRDTPYNPITRGHIERKQYLQIMALKALKAKSG